jgi:hypothetical protein
MIKLGQHCLASQLTIPVFTPHRFAASDFARTIPCLLSVDPQTATAFPLSHGFCIASTEA